MPWKGQPFGWGAAKPYLDFLPEAQDASINAMRKIAEHLREDEIDDGKIKIAVNLIEPPSVDLASRLMFQAYNKNMKLVRTIGGIPKPDPRKSLAKFQLWKYRFKKARPAVPVPPLDISQKCARLAAESYNYERNWRQAAFLARTMSLDQIPNILAVMVHPPRVENGSEAWTWLQRIQLAAAQIVANIELLKQVNVTDSALVQVLKGPVDWTMDAAAIALTQRARQQPECAEAVVSVLAALVRRLPTAGYWSPMETSLQNILLIPGVPGHVRQEAEQTLAMIHQDS